ncbi:MAG TPA: 4'-phosphopantetheinyl transferase superfamily protein [Allocoleopsis sp.]
MLIIKSVIQPIATIDPLLPVLLDIEFFSSYEQHYCGRKANPLASFTGIWCAKTALNQAIRCIVEFPACTFSDFEVCHADNGRPWIGLNHQLAQWCQKQNLSIDLSITHSGDFAAATVLLYTKTKRHLP